MQNMCFPIVGRAALRESISQSIEDQPVTVIIYSFMCYLTNNVDSV